ncbi:MAG: NAD(P)H-dependent oxidoreductase [Actinomycetota bacterium]|jgi:multimeric flavodoxin WrbA|nr:NAD(P)H-dependent oxidoreductase [Actinomycetota bacterium]
MKITIFNGEPDASSEFDAYVHEVAAQMATSGHNVETIDLRDLDIKGCSGCWGCWAKTPGECVKRDDTEQTCRAVVHSDLVVLAAPMVMGFTSALLKRMADQMIPLVHPYGLIEGGEMHHRPRYEHYSLMGLLLGAGPDTDTEDIAITQKMWSRTARNLKTRLAFTSVADRPAKEVAHELATVA